MTPDQTRPGRLFVLATPIGNLGDLTHRAAQTLAQVDLVAAEDTRRTRKLISHLGIKVELISYREQNRAAAGSRILAALEQGRDVGLVSDAGTPVVSDPGADLVARAVEAGLTVIPIPGPSAVAAALSISGFQADCYTFGGFLPAKAQGQAGISGGTGPSEGAPGFFLKLPIVWPSPLVIYCRSWAHAEQCCAGN